MKIDYYKKYLKYKNKYLELKGGTLGASGIGACTFGTCGIGAYEPVPKLSEVKIYADKNNGIRQPWDKSSAKDKLDRVYDINAEKDMTNYMGYSHQCRKGKNNIPVTDEKDRRDIMIQYNFDSLVPAGCGITIGNYNCQAGNTEKKLSEIECKKIEHSVVPKLDGTVFVV